LNKEFIEALDELEKEKGIPKEQLLEALKRALESAYKGRNKSTEENVDVEIDPSTGEIQILHYKNVVETVEDDGTEVSLAEMRSYDPDYEIGDVAVFPVPVEELGRIAAQTAKQVVFQTVRDIERGMVYDEYIGKQNEIITGNVQRVSNETVFVSIGRTEGLMSPGEQVRGERYTVSSRLKFYIVDVRKSQKGPQIFLSRSHPGLVKRLFEIEVPEIQDGIVSIESLAREAGSRTKMAVSSSDDNVDPVGACVGNRGARVQAVVDEIFGEKIDIIPWNDNQEDNIMNALSPAKVEKIILEEGENTATAVVPDYQLSLAIGKEGQNVRLAAKLCGVKIDIKSHTQYYGAVSDIGALDGELDEEGYLNPDDFLSEDAEPEKAAETDEVTEAVIEAEAGDDPDDAAEDATPVEFAEPATAGNVAEDTGESDKRAEGNED
jgi:N utilization substance protein A